MKSWKRVFMLLFLFEISAAYAQDSMTADAVVKRYSNAGIQIRGQFTVPNEGMFGGACLAAQLELKICATDQDCGIAPDGGYAYCVESAGSPLFGGPPPVRSCWVRPGPPQKFCRNSVTLAGAAPPGQPPRTPVPLPQGLNQTPWVRPPTQADWSLLTRDGIKRETRPLGVKLRWAVIACTNRNWRPSPDPDADPSPCSRHEPHPDKLMDLGQSTLVNAVEYKPEAVIVPSTTLKPGQLQQ